MSVNRWNGKWGRCVFYESCWDVAGDCQRFGEKLCGHDANRRCRYHRLLRIHLYDETMMKALNFPILSAITYLPLLGILVICLIKSARHDLIRWVAFLNAVLTFLVSLPLYFMFDSSKWEMQFVEHFPWISEFGISYHMGIDGISILLVLMTTFLSALAILSTLVGSDGRGQGVHDLPPVSRDRHDRRVLFPGLYSFLRVLGSDADTHVFHHWNLGRAT